MKLHETDMLAEIGTAHVMLFTTNATVTASGDLVMGRGAALQAKQRWPTLPRVLGDMIRDGGHGVKKEGERALPYLVRLTGLTAYPTVSPHPPGGDVPGFRGTCLGAFQVKYHWRDQASLPLIMLSIGYLSCLAHAHTETIFALNFPGIGNGRLPRNEILPYLHCLPDNVHVYELPAQRKLL